MIREDGSILSSNTPSIELLEELVEAQVKGILRAIVTKVLYTDDPGNITKDTTSPQITYQAIVVGGSEEGQVIDNIRVAGTLGGQYNYSERVFRANSEFPSGKDFAQIDGDIVYIAFVQGNKVAPVIIGAANHPKDGTNTGATKEEGPRKLEQYNGIKTVIDNLGNLEVNRDGGIVDEELQAFVPEQEEKLIKKFNFLLQDSGINLELRLVPDKEKPEEKIELIVIKDVEVGKMSESFAQKTADAETVYSNEVDLVTAKKDVKITTKETEVSTSVDGLNEKVTQTFKSGLKVESDGKTDKVTITTAGGLTITVDGAGDSANISTAGGDSIDVTPGAIKISENGGGTLNLAGGKVALGNGDELLQIVSDLCDTLSTDLGNLGYNLANAAQYSALKAKVDGIKGSL